MLFFSDPIDLEGHLLDYKYVDVCVVPLPNNYSGEALVPHASYTEKPEETKRKAELIKVGPCDLHISELGS